jgi:hypothetical protein
MSLISDLFDVAIIRGIERAPERIGNLWEIAKERPIVSVGIVGGLFIGTSQPLIGVGLIGVGLWRLIGLSGLIVGGLLIALIGAGL